ncbi:hypothetical protein [Nocardioides ferulae]|uniref:hypothetical protein n=1 Tax=Nocardioides ferulae TaxID=2340821 RepID=UPI00197FD785|nr:hypothetical protein [Nocardioides ferulae]
MDSTRGGDSLEQPAEAPAPAVGPAPDAASPEETAGDPTSSSEAAAQPPDWWHRDHPTFTPLSGFFTGLLFILLVPGTYAAVLGALFDTDTAESLFPFVLVTLAVPVTLVVVPRTRTFGRYMALGVVATALVVGGVAAAVLWYLVNYRS